jgi:uncharacterized membrane protein YkvA (DUF1232 family)
MKQESLFNNQPSNKFQKIIKEHGEIYTNSELLKQSLKDYVVKIKEETAYNEFINISQAIKIKDVCIALVEDYEKFEYEQKKYIVATINYFVTSEDEEDDLFSPLGFDDDTEVLNECLSLINKKELIIELS